jgi:hypothetical protein
MTNYTPIQPARDGVSSAGTPVTATDALTRAVLGSKGVLMEVINAGASPDVVTIGDASTTPSGAPAAAISKSVAAGTSQVFRVLPAQIDPVSNVVAVGHSFLTTVTAKVYPL